MAALTDYQLLTIEIIEWVTSAVSILGTVFIIGTFVFFKSFRKPINRLVTYASIGNILANGATLVARAGIIAGERSALCKYQAVFIQVFLPADSLWTFCMAMNVYLTFFKNYNAAELRALEKWYILGCYSVPLIPAIALLIYDTQIDQNIYGDAVLWCWITKDYDWMRIAFFYGPVWVIIAVTLTMYIITGKDIFRQRKMLRSFSRAHHVPMPRIQNPFTMNNPVAVRKVTEIRVTSVSMSDMASTHAAEAAEAKSSPAAKTSISSRRQRNGPSPLDLSKRATLSAGDSASPSPSPSPSPSYQPSIYEDPDIYIHGPSVECTATISTGEPRTVAKNRPRPTTATTRAMREHNAAMRANTAVWGYAKVAMLMFVAMLVIWVPSTFNRVYSLIFPKNTVFILNALAAAVLPMQGFWNCAIYIATSWPQCKDAYRQVGLDKLIGRVGAGFGRLMRTPRWPGMAPSASNSEAEHKGAEEVDCYDVESGNGSLRHHHRQPRGRQQTRYDGYLQPEDDKSSGNGSSGKNSITPRITVMRNPSSLSAGTQR